MWPSNTTTSFQNENELTEKSHKILLEEFSKFTKQVINKDHKIDLKEIWANEYLEKDFQEIQIEQFMK